MSRRMAAKVGPVAAELPADHVLRAEGLNRLEDLHLLVADGLAVPSGGRPHGEIRDALEEVILDDVANGPD